MSILTHLIHSAAEGAAYTGLAYAGTVGSITALIAVAAPTAERRRDARAVLKLYAPHTALRIANADALCSLGNSGLHGIPAAVEPAISRDGAGQ